MFTSGPSHDRRARRVPTLPMIVSVLVEPFRSLRGRRPGRRCPQCNTAVADGEERCARCAAPVAPAAAPLFRVVDRHSPLTLEAIGAYLIVLVMAGASAWMYLEPVLWRFAPALNATKIGPETFPATVRIGETGLEVTNGSTEAWTCNVVLRAEPRVQAGLALAPGQSRELPYRLFRRGETPMSDAAGYYAARRGITLRCADASGERLTAF